ncbi:MAG: hypothetical protein JST68_19615 [Bacteroidetes bacterium]|nr:hypothetical protein [Bacteroidota bacterium]
MKLVLSLTAFVLMTVRLFGQTSYEPQLLILSPGSVQFEKAFEKEIATLNETARRKGGISESMPPNELKAQPDNVQQMIASETEFAKNMDFAKMVSTRSEQYLAYRFFEKFPNLLILLKDVKSVKKIEDLEKIASDSKIQYVLNFPSLSFYGKDGSRFARLAVQLYDHSTRSLLIDTTYIGDECNNGFEFACDDGTLSCTINNSISQALERVVYEIAMHSPTIIRERKLAQERMKVLRDSYYTKSFDKSFVAPILPAADSEIVLNNLYQLLVSDDRTKFVGFFLGKKDPQSFGQLSQNQQDKEVEIINNKNIRDSGYLDNIPHVYAYIVKAVKYKDQWYYEKSNVTYFEPEDGQGGKLQYFNRLQEWGFFKDNSAEPSADFWETHLFKKIMDLRKDPDWNKYGTSIWKREEEENRKYIGLYEIVADKMKGKSLTPTVINVK